MRALLAIATLLLACGAAQAQYTFEYEGRTIRIDPDRGTVSIPGVYDNTGKKAKRARTDQDGSQKAAPTQQQTTGDRQTTPVKPPAQAHLPAPVNAAPSAPNATTNTAPADSAALPMLPPLPPPPAPAPVRQPVAPVDVPAASAAAVPQAPVLSPAPVARPQAPAPAVSTAPALSPSPAPRPQVPSATVATIAPPSTVPDPNSPVGIWLTEEKEGKVRIEPCGANLCGYSLDSKSNANAEQVLINMKPAKDQKWNGRIHDPNTGSDYDSTIALKGKDELRVQGCAFGGMFCGGQTWTRVN